MLAAYIVAAIVGGGMIVFSALAGLGAHADVGGDLGHDVGGGHGSVDHGAAGGHDVSHDAEHGHDTDHGTGALWLPFFSIRFWTYAVGTFGLIGSVLSLTRVSIEPITLAISATAGLLMGTLAAWIVRYLNKAEYSSTATEDDFLGALAQVTVPIGELPGKVRTSVRGDIIDFVALSDPGEQFAPGEEVMIVGIEGDKARVARKKDFLGE